MESKQSSKSEVTYDAGLPAPIAGRVLGIDTSLRATGAGVVDFNGNRPRALCYDVLRNAAALPLSECLLSLDRRLSQMLGETLPAAAAIESVFFCRNAQTALLLGHARGIAIAACARAGVPVYAYAPRRVKQAVVGYGAAAKHQVQHMVMSLLALPKLPPEDAADALALAICHWHTIRRPLNAAAEPL